jgi:TrmH family RNA methyltransferase
LHHNIHTLDTIASRKNPLVAEMRRLAQAGHGYAASMLLDGLHLVEEARAARIAISSAAFSTRALAEPDGRARRVAMSLAGIGVRVVQAPDLVLEAMSPAAAPSGVVAIASRPRHDLAQLLPPAVVCPLIVVAVDVQDPGNLGAMARVAEAGGATGLVATGSSADPFGWKALRGAMGSAFRLPIVRARDTDAALDAIAAAGLHVIATASGHQEPFNRLDWTVPAAVLFGSEGAGLPPQVLARADRRTSIPMQPPVESLNVAVATGLLVYEARRQRRGDSQIE